MNRKKIFLATAAIIAAQGANAATVSRIDVNGNQRMDAETINLVAEEFGFKTEYVSAEVSEAVNEEEDDEEA